MNSPNKYKNIAIITILLLLSTFAKAQKPNILFIAVDDLNCDFGAYGNSDVLSPNLDKLATEGTIFTNNHCPQAVCGASRASILSGWLPQKSGIKSFRQYLRDLYPSMVTIPLFFKNNGYEVEGMGKIHDYRNVSEYNGDTYDAISWNTFFEISASKYYSSTGKPVTENKAINDNDYKDGLIADKAVERVEVLAQKSKPFFLAVGFSKPHLPFNAPTKYWDLYDRSKLELAEFTNNAANDYEDFYNYGSEFRNNYDGMPQEGDFSEELQRELIHGYYACISYIDSQVGKIISALKQSGEYNNTIIVFWGDHGFHLGDHSMWGKHTNFEQATRSPLIIKAPGYASDNATASPTGLIDIFPTLCDLTGFETPADKDGKSLKPLLVNPDNDVNPFTLSRFSRGGYNGNALRSEQYRFVEWVKNEDIKYQLFDYETDPLEKINKAYMPEYQYLVDSLSVELNDYLLNIMGSDFNFGFEHLNEDNKPLNWMMKKQNSVDGTFWADEYNKRTGNYCMAIENSNAGDIGDLELLLVPNYKTENDLQVKFYAKGTPGVEVKVSVGYNYESDEPKHTVSESFILTSNYQLFEAYFVHTDSDKNEKQSSISLGFQLGANEGTCYIDDVELVANNPVSNLQKVNPNKLVIYPNPVNNEFRIDHAFPSSAYELYNVNGVLIKAGFLVSSSATIDINTLPQGIYFFNVKQHEEYSSHKIIKL